MCRHLNKIDTYIHAAVNVFTCWVSNLSVSSVYSIPVDRRAHHATSYQGSPGLSCYQSSTSRRSEFLTLDHASSLVGQTYCIMDSKYAIAHSISIS